MDDQAIENDAIITGRRCQASGRGSRAIFVLAFVAVVREGIELTLFLTAASFTTTTQATLTGALLGLLTAILLGLIIFNTTVKLNLQKFFIVTGALLIFSAAGPVAQSIHKLNEIGWIPSVIEHIWDINHILDEKSTVGSLLKALFAYNGNPSLTELAGYLIYLGLIGIAVRKKLTLFPTGWPTKAEA